jgi:AAA domain-containing protein
MLYMIGGAPRSGKTTLARRMLAEHGLDYFSIDVLIGHLAGTQPELGLRVQDPAMKRVEIVWPVLRKVARDVLRSGDDLVLEGDVLLPRHLMEFGHGSHTGIKACFIGYADVEPEKKLREIREHAAGGADWTEELDDVRLLNLIGDLRAFSEYLRRECCHYKIPYFDGSTCFAGAVRDAKTYLQSAL